MVEDSEEMFHLNISVIFQTLFVEELVNFSTQRGIFFDEVGGPF